MFIQVQLFIMVFIVIFLVYEFILLKDYKDKKKKKKKKSKDKGYPMEVRILRDFYHLDVKQLNYNNLLHFVAVVSSLDIAFIVSIAGLFRIGLIQILVAFILVLPVIFFSYYLINLYYRCKLKRRKKDE